MSSFFQKTEKKDRKKGPQSPTKRSNMGRIFRSSGSGSNNDLPNELNREGSSAALTTAMTVSGTTVDCDQVQARPLMEKRSSMGHINKAVSASGAAVRSAVFAPVVAGKAVMKGSVKAAQETVTFGQTLVDGTRSVVDQSVKTTTNIAKVSTNTVISGSKAVGGTVLSGSKAVGGTVLGGGKAIVGGTSSLVESGGKKFVEGTKGLAKGTKGVVMGITNVATLKGFNSSRSVNAKKSKWEKGIEVIESLLEPGTDTFEAMTPEQRKELANVKKLLITGPGQNEKIAHIPLDLIDLKKSENANTGNERRLSSNFILQEFAGLKDASLLGGGSDLDSSESSEGGASHGESNANAGPGKALSPIPRTKPKIQIEQHENSHANLDAIFCQQGGSAHDDPASIENFVPIEFTYLSKGDQIELFNLLSWKSIGKWDFDIFHLSVITKYHPLLFIGWAVLGSPYAQSTMAKQIGLDYEPANDEAHGYGFTDELMIPPQKLCNYLRVIESDYRADNPYHNNIHAADVLQSLHTLIQMSLDEPFLAGCPQIKIFAILLAAAIHDVDHPGKTNAFHTNSRTELAVMYNDTSVLENWHVAHAFARLLDIKLTGSPCIHDSKVIANMEKQANNDSETNFLCNARPEQFKTIRNLIIEAVLHTDMTKHFAMVNAAKGLLRQQDKEENTWKVLMFMLHMADISGQAKAGPLFQKWTDRCMDEFFAQGDEEAALGLPISPNCDRTSVVPAESQVGFIKFVVEPAYEVLGMFVPFVENFVLPIIDRNLGYWLDKIDSDENYGDASTEDDSSPEVDTSERQQNDLDASTVSQNGDSQPEANGVACKGDSLVTTSIGATGQVLIDV